MLKNSLSIALVGLALLGCPPVTACPTGQLWYPDEGRCRVPDSDAPDRDAGSDTPASDVPCGGCTLPLVCDASSGDCVECIGTDASTCTDATDNACVAGACVGCDGPEDCAEVTASQCGGSNECIACTSDPGCSHLTATPVCDEARGTCVACTTDTEATRCGANACIVATGVCGSVARNSRDTCDSCQADSECVTGRRCIDHVFGGSSVGTFCFLDAAGGCGDTDMTLRPYSTRMEAMSLGGITATYCFPPATTTCAGIADARSTSCTLDSMCGLADVNDGYCPTVGTGVGLCSYRCGGAVDCRDPLSCGGTPGHCRP